MLTKILKQIGLLKKQFYAEIYTENSADNNADNNAERDAASSL